MKAADRFFSALDGVTDPEVKRKAIGETFIRVFEEVRPAMAGRRPGFLVQGTLYPDVIESGSPTPPTSSRTTTWAACPMTWLRLGRAVPPAVQGRGAGRGEEPGLPDDIVWRQPFPGPGLAVRIVGEGTPERADILRAADAIVTEEIRRAGVYRELWQSFAVLPAVRTVGVMGDGRTYAYPS